MVNRSAKSLQSQFLTDLGDQGYITQLGRAGQAIVGGLASGVQAAVHGSPGQAINHAFYNLGFNAAWNVAQGAGAGGKNSDVRLTSSLSGGDGSTKNAAAAMAFFMSKGLTRSQAAGIVGNLQAESGANLSPSAYNPADGGHYGIAQWSGSRFGKLGSPQSFQAQLAGVWKELSGSYSPVLSAVKGTSSAAQAAADIYFQYEVANTLAGYNSGTGDRTLPNREANANALATISAAVAKASHKHGTAKEMAMFRPSHPVSVKMDVNIEHLHTDDEAAYRKLMKRMSDDFKQTLGNLAYESPM
jgi:hypothetical protein